MACVVAEVLANSKRVQYQGTRARWRGDACGYHNRVEPLPVNKGPKRTGSRAMISRAESAGRLLTTTCAPRSYFGRRGIADERKYSGFSPLGYIVPFFSRRYFSGIEQLLLYGYSLSGRSQGPCLAMNRTDRYPKTGVGGSKRRDVEGGRKPLPWHTAG